VSQRRHAEHRLQDVALPRLFRWLCADPSTRVARCARCWMPWLAMHLSRTLRSGAATSAMRSAALKQQLRDHAAFARGGGAPTPLGCPPAILSSHTGRVRAVSAAASVRPARLHRLEAQAHRDSARRRTADCGPMVRPQPAAQPKALTLNPDLFCIRPAAFSVSEPSAHTTRCCTACHASALSVWLLQARPVSGPSQRHGRKCDARYGLRAAVLTTGAGASRHTRHGNAATRGQPGCR
jgi:hypothetical protein